MSYRPVSCIVDLPTEHWLTQCDNESQGVCLGLNLLAEPCQLLSLLLYPWPANSDSLLMSAMPNQLPGHAALQAVHSLHQQNHGHCDIKYHRSLDLLILNVAVSVVLLGCDQTLACCTLADMGSSTCSHLSSLCCCQAVLLLWAAVHTTQVRAMFCL